MSSGCSQFDLKADCAMVIGVEAQIPMGKLSQLTHLVRYHKSTVPRTPVSSDRRSTHRQRASSCDLLTIVAKSMTRLEN